MPSAFQADSPHGDQGRSHQLDEHAVEQQATRRVPRFAVPGVAATLATAVVIAGAVAVGSPDQPVTAAAAISEPLRTPTPSVRFDPEDSPYLMDRDSRVSRSAKRVTLEKKPAVKEREFMTEPLNLWPAPTEKGEPLAVLPRGGTVAITGARKRGFAEILHRGQVRWVNAAYLADEMPPEPEPTVPSDSSPAPGGSSEGSSSGSSASSDSSGSPDSSGGLSSAPCPDGSAVESGLTSSAVRLYRAVCNAFPALSSYGGFANRGEHGTGRAIDFMTSDPGLGQAVADYARANAGDFGIYDIIWAQRIWTPARGSEGWRPMSDRGSATANHFDHVHIAVN